ncbi:MAG: hypothetical protein HDT29_04075 [Clostridiales bacterium]|nr:hypothetical protein [Clostridiales bacterium]
MKRSNISKTTTYHYIKLAWRSLLLLTVLIVYIVNKVQSPQSDFSLEIFTSNAYVKAILIAIWAIFVIEILLRFFPSKIESMGCQKQFKRNYVPKEPAMTPNKQSGWRTFAALAAWLALNAIFVTLYFTHIIDDGIMIIISLFYSVSDMICILFFCPFQTWFMKNRCCVSCRIYNWDFAMMFTPVVFINNAFCISIFALAVLLLLEWEILYRKFPERFCRNTNETLSCANCKEKLCKHKKQLQSFIKKINIIEKRKNQ